MYKFIFTLKENRRIKSETAKVFGLSLFFFFLFLQLISAQGFIKQSNSFTTTTYSGNLTNISQMQDVDTLGVVDGQALVYNDTTGKWEPLTISGIVDTTCDGETCDVTNTGTLDGYEGIDLLDNTDNQTLSFLGGNISISGGNSINISSIDTDTNETTRFDNLVGNCSAGDLVFGFNPLTGEKYCVTPSGTGDNSSWNESYANTLYYGIDNPFSFFNVTYFPFTHLSNFTDDLGDRGYTSNSNFTNDEGYVTNATMNKTVSCSDIVGGTDTDFCVDAEGSVGGLNWSEIDNETFYYNTNPFGFFNSTNPQIENDPQWTDNFTKYNTSWSLDTNTNCSSDSSCSNILYESDLPLENKTLVNCANITGAASNLCTLTASGEESDPLWTGNSSLVIYTSQEPDLNVNSSDYWDGLDSYNTTWFENVAGVFGINLTTLSSYFDSLFSGKTTDDLIEGSTNLYDNKSWNESKADLKYLQSESDPYWTDNFTKYNTTWSSGTDTNCSVEGSCNLITYDSELDYFSGSWNDLTDIPVGFSDDVDNDTTYSSLSEFNNDVGYWNDTYATFNKTYADTLYAGIGVTGDNSSWNQSLANTLYYGIDNPFGFYNSTNPQTETDPFWSDNFTKYNTSWSTDTNTEYDAGSNLTLVGTTFSVDMTSVKNFFDTIYQGIGSYLTSAVESLRSSSDYITLNDTSGDVEVGFDETLLNQTILSIAEANDNDTTYTNSSFDLSEIPNSGDINITNHNLQNINSSSFCNGGTCWNMYVNGSGYFIIEEI